MGALSELLGAATSATHATQAANTAGESQESQGVRPEIRTWAQWDGRQWHGVAVGEGFWQWCGRHRTLAQALQAAERVRP